MYWLSASLRNHGHTYKQTPQKALQSQKRPDQDLFNLCIAPTPKQGAWHCAGRCKRSLAMQPACSNANYHCCGGLCTLSCYVTVCISFSPVLGCQVLRRGASYKLRAMPPFSHSSGKKSFGRGRTLRASCRVCSPSTFGRHLQFGRVGGTHLRCESSFCKSAHGRQRRAAR